jgi:intracellular sulfur oxidation DsrE/DsrF family protein
MKRTWFAGLLSLALVLVISGGITRTGLGAQAPQAPAYKVVFDLTSSDPLDQQAVLRWIKEVSAVNPKNELEVVMYGRGLDLVVSGKSANAAGVAEAISGSHATFNVCAIAMKNQQIDKSQLLPNVRTVPDGIGEIVAKQHADWGYIKVGH